jgi:hypothetical protein
MKPNSIRLLYLGAVTFVSVTLFLNCTKDIGVPPPPPLVNCDTISYLEDIKKLADENCVRCHQPGLTNGGYDFTTYGGLKSASDAGKLEFVIFEASPPKKMPQDSTNVLTEIEKAMIKCWVENGEKP